MTGIDSYDINYLEDVKNIKINKLQSIKLKPYKNFKQ